MLCIKSRLNCSHSNSHTRETISMWILSEMLCSKEYSYKTHSNSHKRETIPVWILPGILCRNIRVNDSLSNSQIVCTLFSEFFQWSTTLLKSAMNLTNIKRPLNKYFFFAWISHWSVDFFYLLGWPSEMFSYVWDFIYYWILIYEISTFNS